MIHNGVHDGYRAKEQLSASAGLDIIKFKKPCCAWFFFVMFVVWLVPNGMMALRHEAHSESALQCAKLDSTTSHVIGVGAKVGGGAQPPCPAASHVKSSVSSTATTTPPRARMLGPSIAMVTHSESTNVPALHRARTHGRVSAWTGSTTAR